MTVNYTTNLALGQPVTGTESGTWGDDVNNSVTSYLDIAISGSLALTSASFTSNALTLANTQGTSSATNIGATTAQYYVLRLSSLAANVTITAPSVSKTYLVVNADATYSATIKASGQTGISVAAGERATVYYNGTDYIKVTSSVVSNFTGVLGVANGGTGVTTSTGSGNNVLSTSPTLVTPILGTPTSGTLTNATGLPLTTGVTGTLPVANGGTGVTTSTGSGNTVLSTSPTLVTPILGTPTSGNLANCTFPTLNQNTTGTAAGLSATLAVASGGTGVTTSTGSGNNVLSTSPTLVTPILGTPTSGNLANCTFPTLNQNTTGTAAGLSATLAVASGGTGLTTTPANGALDIGNGSGFTRATLTAGSNVTITNSAGGITIAATNSGGTVTSVTGTAPVVSSGGTTPAISMAAANTSTNGYLTSTDWNTFNGKQAAGSYITSGGALGTPSSGTATNLTGLPLSTGVTGTLPVANGGTGVTTSTGSGNNVLSTSPTLVTPVLGTPASGNLANCTFPTLNQTTTGASGSVANSGGWNITPSGTKLYFNYNGTNVGSLDSSGNFIVAGNVTAYGAP